MFNTGAHNLNNGSIPTFESFNEPVVHLLPSSRVICREKNGASDPILMPISHIDVDYDDEKCARCKFVRF